MIKSWTEHLVGNAARKKLIKGVHTVAEVVRTTLGAKGSVVVWAGRHGSFGITQDGVSVAKRLELKNQFEHLGARILQQADMQTDKDIGDGTTTTTVLADAILSVLEDKYGITDENSIEHFDGVRMVKELEAARDKVIENLREQKRDITSPEEVRNVALVSSLSEEIADILKEMYQKLGSEMLIAFDTNMYGNTLRYKIDEGMEINSGWMSRGMATNPNTMECELENVPVFITDEKMDNPALLKEIVDKTSQIKGSKNILIVADDFNPAVVFFALANKLKGWNILLVKAPSLGIPKLWWLEDMCALTGSCFISQSRGRSLRSANTDDLGVAKKVVAGEMKTLLVGSKTKEELAGYITEIRNQMEQEKDKGIHEKRISKLSSGVGRMEIGGHTRQEAEERKDKIKDAVSSVKAALRGGVVQGGGFALLSAGRKLEGKTNGEKVLALAVEKPLFWIASNAGLRGKEVVDGTSDKGFNVNTAQYEDLFASGIVDALPVVESALRKAVIVASQILRASSTIVMVEKEVKETPQEAYADVDLNVQPTAEEIV